MSDHSAMVYNHSFRYSEYVLTLDFYESQHSVSWGDIISTFIDLNERICSLENQLQAIKNPPTSDQDEGGKNE